MITSTIKVSAFTAAMVVALGWSGIAFAQDAIRITSWGGASQDAENKAWYAPYSAETGISVLEDSWNGEFGLIQAMVEAGAVKWDVINGDYEHAVAGCDVGILETIDVNQLGGESHFLPGTVHPCGVATHLFSVIFAYDENNIPAAWGDARPETIVDMFDAAKFPGKRTLRNDPKWMFEAVLMADGVPPDQVYEVLGTEEGVDRVLRKLDTIRNDVVWWTSGAQAPQLLADGEVAIAEIFATRLYGANTNENQNFVPVWDGQVYAANSWIIPKGANKEAAMAFLKYVTQPEVVVRIVGESNYGLAIVGTDQFIPEEIRSYIPTSAENLTRALASGEEFWADHHEQINQRFKAWQTVE
jgi:putative spermidine/putrescine transport system substrate-binding protein